MKSESTLKQENFHRSLTNALKMTVQRVIQFEALEKINATSLQVITEIDHYVTFTVKNSIFLNKEKCEAKKAENESNSKYNFYVKICSHRYFWGLITSVMLCLQI